MKIKDYMNADKEEQRRYTSQIEDNLLMADLNDLIWQMSKQDLEEHIKAADENGLTIMLNEISRRLQDAELTRTGRELIDMDFDMDKNSTRDFISAIQEYKEYKKRQNGNRNE